MSSIIESRMARRSEAEEAPNVAESLRRSSETTGRVVTPPQSRIRSPRESSQAVEPDPQSRIRSPRESLQAVETAPQSRIRSPRDSLQAAETDPQSRIRSPRESAQAVETAPQSRIRSPRESLQAAETGPQSRIRSPRESSQITAEVEPPIQIKPVSTSGVQGVPSTLTSKGRGFLLNKVLPQFEIKSAETTRSSLVETLIAPPPALSQHPKPISPPRVVETAPTIQKIEEK